MPILAGLGIVPGSRRRVESVRTALVCLPLTVGGRSGLLGHCTVLLKEIKATLSFCCLKETDLLQSTIATSA